MASSALPSTMPPELLKNVGFERTKVGTGDKETGYQIKESSLSSLLGSACICFLIMGFMVVSMVYDVHFEKKTLHRQLRQEEHHAASKLAQVQMELWSEFHNDIKESHEAQALLKSMNESYSTLQGKIKAAVNDLSAELVLNPQKAEKFADKLLHLVADVHMDNVKHAKHLVDHLVNAGKRSVKLEKHVEKAVVSELKEEKKQMDADKKAGLTDITPPPHKANEKEANLKEHLEEQHKKGGKELSEEEEEDPLKEMLTGFFFTFDDFEKEFGDKPRKTLKVGHPVYDSIVALFNRTAEGEMSDEDMSKELDKIDLASVGAGLGSGRALPVQDIIEELHLIPKLPYKKLAKMKDQWKKGEADSLEIFEELQEMHAKKIIPSGWLQSGVNTEEDDEEKEEEDEEEREEKEETE